MQLGETIATYDVALALRGESGKFDVTSPTGETYHVVCAPNHSITKLEWSGNSTNPDPFLIRKVAEPVTAETGKSPAEMMESAAKARAVKSPFLIDSSEVPKEDPKAVNKDLPTLVAKNAETGLKSRRMAEIDLLFLESDPETKQPSACVCLKTAPEQHGETLVTTPCTNFNDLDAEIRRLHAQLDDIRYRARKRFYQAQNVAASA
jgi:hypothetical protein